MQTSKLSSKSQITLPKEIRDTLGARPGDTIVYEIEGDMVRLRRQDPFDVEFHKAISAALSEWVSDEDEEAFSAVPGERCIR